MSPPNTSIAAAKQRLADALEDLKQRHVSGCAGKALCAALSDRRDAVVLDLFEAALADLAGEGAEKLRSQVALVAHGGYGRRDVAPYSDVDLMILHAPGVAEQVAPLAERLVRDVFDSGLVFGHSVRTPPQACRLAAEDPSICTSLIESRLLSGDTALFEQFTARFRRQIGQRSRTLTLAIDRARREERARYGETVFLLEPNVKRSGGGLRDLQLLRWIGCSRYGTNVPSELQEQGILSEPDLLAVDAAEEFLLRLRNELHFHAGRAVDVLGREEQLRVAEVFGYRPAAGMLPVEEFMRHYFRLTGGLSHVVSRFVAKALTRRRVSELVNAAFGHRVEGGVRVGPAGLMATREGLKPLRGSLTEIMRLVALANLYDKPIAPPTWDVVRREAARLPDELPSEACHRFLALLAHPARLGPLLRDLHETAVLERFLPEFAHARGLMQFNRYHKYTVDEHSLRAVEFATDLNADTGSLGRAYRQIEQKDLLHLALLIHDLGKGHDEDHSEVGLRIAEAAAQRLGLSRRRRETLEFLVHRHLLMNHLAFRRDTADPQLALQFAVEVGSPELLRMLYVLTAADLGAVGPGVWDAWKDQIITDLYRRAMQHLTMDGADGPAQSSDQCRRAIRDALGRQQDDPWFVRQLDALPTGYLESTGPQQIVADLRLLRGVEVGRVVAEGRYLAETETVQFTVGTHEQITPGVFHKLTGALTAAGLQIRSAEINTMADSLVLDRFCVFDPDFTGPPPAERLEEVEAALTRALTSAEEGPPSFRRTWQAGRNGNASEPAAKTRVKIDNSTSKQHTILDVFAVDRPGLAYAVARGLFELDLSVWRAKIGTYLDQVVDVFYVTDRRGGKIDDEPRLERTRGRLREVIESLD